MIDSIFQKYGGSIALDGWMDSCRRIAYFGLTIHFITSANNKLTLNDRVLVIRELSNEHKTGAYLKSKVLEYMMEFELLDYMEKKIVFVSDRGKNITNSLDSFNSAHCFAHLMNNTVAKVLEKDKKIKNDADQLWSVRLTVAVTAIVKYFKVTGLNSKFKPTLKSNMPTRWNTVLTMFDSVILHWEQINNILRSSKKHLDDLNKISLDELKMLRDLLLPFKAATDDIEGSKYPTLCLVYPNFIKIQNHLKMQPSDSIHIAQCKEILAAYWENTVKNCLTDYHYIAVFLHPLMKNLKTLTPETKAHVWNKTIEMMNDFMPSTTAEVQQSRATDNRSMNNKQQRNAAIILCMGSDSETEMEQLSEAESEIDEYKRFRVRSASAESFNLLQWWENEKTKFPRLYGVIRFVHAIPGSSAAAERLFSMAGRMLSGRSNMRSKLVDDMLFLRCNLDLAREIDEQYIDIAEPNDFADQDETEIENIRLDSDDVILIDIECDR